MLPLRPKQNRHLDTTIFFFYAESMGKVTKKSASVKKAPRKHNYINFFVLILGGLIIGLAVAYPAQNVIIKAAEKVGIVQVSETTSALSWDKIPGADSYSVYYREVGDSEFTYAINVPSSITQYVLPELKPGAQYEYKIAALNANHEEFLWTPISPLSQN